MFWQFVDEQWMLITIWMILIILWLTYENRKAGKQVSPQMLTQLVNQQNAVIVDVRDASEFRNGHISGAMNIPHAQFAKQKSDLEKYKDKPIILVCKMGQHSAGLAKQLNSDGFEQVYRLTGGVTEWQNSQLPLIKA